MTDKTSSHKTKSIYPKRKAAASAEPAQPANLKEEIDTLRKGIIGLSEWIDKDGDLTEQLRLLAVVSQAGVRLAAMLKAQQALTGRKNGLSEEVNKGIEEALEIFQRELEQTSPQRGDNRP